MRTRVAAETVSCVYNNEAAPVKKNQQWSPKQGPHNVKSQLAQVDGGNPMIPAPP